MKGNLQRTSEPASTEKALSGPSYVILWDLRVEFHKEVETLQSLYTMEMAESSEPEGRKVEKSYS